MRPASKDRPGELAADYIVDKRAEVVRFVLAADDSGRAIEYVDVMIRGEGDGRTLDVASDRILTVTPWAANTVRINTRQRFS